MKKIFDNSTLDIYLTTLKLIHVYDLFCIVTLTIISIFLSLNLLAYEHYAIFLGFLATLRTFLCLNSAFKRKQYTQKMNDFLTGDS